jgi:hypothetical protein
MVAPMLATASSQSLDPATPSFKVAINPLIASDVVFDTSARRCCDS